MVISLCVEVGGRKGDRLTCLAMVEAMSIYGLCAIWKYSVQWKRMMISGG